MEKDSSAYRAALYLRLSRDDEGIGESSSITNQRRLLTAYAQEHGYAVTGEYADDGWSGTSFDRPAFRRMIGDIEDGRINMVLLKDLSRLGRDYIRTGQYAEVYFPSKKVRCIAVNDGFDSDAPCGDMVPFKNVVNEMYARDTSRKIRSAFAVKRRSGSFIGSFAPYGYRKDPADKNHLLPDEETADTVRRIFARAADGVRPGDIAGELNRAGVLPPGLCRPHPPSGAGDSWTAGSVSRILRNVVYLGKTAQGKTVKISFKLKKSVRNPPSEWVVVPGTHEPLVTPEVFALAERRRAGRRCAPAGRFRNLFSGFAVCADCGRGMSSVGTRRRGSPASLACGGYKLRGSAACSSHFIDYNALWTVVLDAVRAQAALLTAEERAALPEAALRALEGRSVPAEPSPPEGARLRELVEQLCRSRLSGVLGQEEFDRLLEKYTPRETSPAPSPTGPSPAGLSPADLSPADLSPADLSPVGLSPVGLSPLLAACLFPQEPDEALLEELVERIEVGQARYEKAARGRLRFQTVKIFFRFSAEPETREVLL